MSIFDFIQRLNRDDSYFTQLFERAQESAQLYLLAKQRQKGCDEMGEVATLKDEFISQLNEVIRFSQEKGDISGDIEYDIDAMASEIIEIK